MDAGHVVENGAVTDSRTVRTWLTDMDGVLVHENTALPGAAALIQQWRDTGQVRRI